MALTKSNVLQQLGDHALNLAGPLVEIRRDSRLLLVWLEGRGWSVTEVFRAFPGMADVEAVERSIDALIGSLPAIAEAVKADSLPEFVQGLAALGQLAEAIYSTVQELTDQGDPTLNAATLAQIRDALVADLGEVLLMRAIGYRWPKVFDVLELLGLVERVNPAPIVVGSGASRRVLRAPRLSRRVRFDRLMPLIQDPVGTLTEVYLPRGKLDTAADAQALTDRLYPRLEVLTRRGGGYLRRGRRRAGADGGPTGRMALLNIPTGPNAGLFVSARVMGAKETDNPHKIAGVDLRLGGGLSLDTTVDDWTFHVGATGSIGALFVGEKVVVGSGTDANARIDASATWAHADGSPVLVVGPDSGTQVSIGSLAWTGFLAPSGTATDVGVGAEMKGAKLKISAGDGDAFVGDTLPKSPLEATLDLGLVWSRLGGLRLSGQASVEVLIPIGLTLFNVVTIDYVRIFLELSGDGFETELTVTGRLDVGPLHVVVTDIGLKMDGTMADGGRGNAGPFDLEFGFRPPSGLGVSLDLEGVVTGGGFLDCKDGRYTGAAFFQAASIGFTAFGILDTNLAEAPGWALFFTMGVDLCVPLAFGFILEGAGGFVGLNRTMDPDALAARLKDGVLDRLMFPEDPVRDAVQLREDADAVFPIAAGQFVFGPLVEIGWGKPTIVSAKLGVALTFPDFAIAILGDATAALPNPESPLLILNMGVMGYFSPADGIMWVQASIYDSTLLGVIELSGDMAFYLSIGSASCFVLSVGGFHPDWKPPASLPSALTQLARLSGRIVISSAVTVGVSGYFAVTSNSLQIGSKAELIAKAKFLGTEYTAKGSLGFDALIILTPFSFRLGVSITVAIYAGGAELLSASLSGDVWGPKPWKAALRAEFKVLCVKVHFKVEFGSRASAARAKKDVWTELLRPALQDPEAWEAGTGGGWVSLRAPSGQWMAPQGAVSLRQTVAPLNRDISLYGEYAVTGKTRFDVGAAGFGGVACTSTSLRELFSPAQFEEMSEHEKLSAPSFEPMDAGLSFDTRAYVTANSNTTSLTVGYEEVVEDGPPTRRGALLGAKPRRFGQRPLAAVVDEGLRVEPLLFAPINGQTGEASGPASSFSLALRGRGARDIVPAPLTRSLS